MFSCIRPKEGSPLTVNVCICCSPADPSSMSSQSLSQRLPFPAFPLRASLPPLALHPASTPAPVQAAAPPAEYHSDSAESLEEIPVALAKLGSSSASSSSHMAAQLKLPPLKLPSPSPHTRTKRNTLSSRQNKSTAELGFEMSSTQPPTVFVSHASGEVA